MIIQHWKTRRGKHEIFVEQIFDGCTQWHEARFLTNGNQRAHSIRNTRVAMDKHIAHYVSSAALIDGIHYTLQGAQNVEA